MVDCFSAIPNRSSPHVSMARITNEPMMAMNNAIAVVG
jgi:hypothetical protein